MAPPSINKNGGKPAEPGFVGFGGRAGVFGPYYPITHAPLHVNGGGTVAQPNGSSSGGQLEKLAEIVDGVGGAKKDGVEPGPEPVPVTGQHQPDALGQHGGAKGSPADGAAAGGGDHPMPVKRKYNSRAKLWDGTNAKQQRKRKADEQIIVIDVDESKKGGKPTTKLAAPPLAPSAIPATIAVATAQKKPRLLEKSTPKTKQDLPPQRAVLVELNKVTEAPKEQEVPKAKPSIKQLFDLMKKDIQNFYWKMIIPQVIVYSPDEAWPRRIAIQNWVGTMMYQLLQPTVMCNSCRTENAKWSQDRFLFDNEGFLHFSQKFCPLCIWSNMYCADGILHMREEERKASYHRFHALQKAKKVGGPQ